MNSPLKRSVLPVSSLAALLASVLAAGCSAAAVTDGAPAPTAVRRLEVTRAPGAVTAHGRVKRIGEALGQVALRADQRAQLESLAAEAEARHASGLVARQDLAEALAQQVASGTLDRAALAPKVDAMAAEARASEQKDRAAFEAVHALLDPGQRAELAEALESGGRGAHEGHDWKPGMGHHPGQQWADDLQLTDAQRETFQQILQDSFEGHRADGEHGRGFAHGAMRGKAILEAFKADTFSFDAVAPAEDVGARVAGMSARLLDVVEKVLPLLTADQRGLAAQKIREHADRLPVAP